MQKGPLLEVLNSSTPWLLLLLILGFLLLITSMQIYLYSMISTGYQKRLQNINTTNQLIQHEICVNEMVMWNNEIYINDKYGINISQKNSSERVNYSLIIQATNNRFKPYSLNRYAVIQEDNSTVRITGFHLVTNLFAQLLATTYLNIPSVRMTSLDYINKNYMTILNSSFTEYRQNILI